MRRRKSRSLPNFWLRLLAVQSSCPAPSSYFPAPSAVIRMCPLSFGAGAYGRICSGEYSGSGSGWLAGWGWGGQWAAGNGASPGAGAYPSPLFFLPSRGGDHGEQDSQAGPLSLSPAKKKRRYR